MTALPSALVDDIVAHWPVPVADAVLGLAAAETAHERRDRVVEVFRTTTRVLAGYALAARLQFGPGPGDPSRELEPLLQSLRRRGLTDGQWIALCRELLRPWSTASGTHVLPELVGLFHGRGKLGPELDGLLAMRRKETVAHGPTGDADAIDELLQKRVPQLQALLSRVGPVLTAHALVVPVDGERALRLMGATPHRGRWRRVPLGSALPVGQPVLVGDDGTPRLALHPVASLAAPAPGAVEELFWLDGGARRGVTYIAFPSMAERVEGEAASVLEALVAGTDGEEGAREGAPFRGLASFTAADADLFHGRGPESDALANRVRRSSFVTVTGTSGSGKSSLVHAGLIPRLADWTVATLRPGLAPDRSLGTALSEALQLPPDALESADAVHAACRARQTRLVLVVDQAEELLTLGGAEARGRALARIADLGADPSGPTRVVLCVREDFFARLVATRWLKGLGDREVVVVAAPDRQGLLATLIEPAARYGTTFEGDLAATMVDEVAGEPAALALLQFCAAQLWERRDRSWKRLTLEAYAQLGGVSGALAHHAEGVYVGLNPQRQARARGLLLKLVTPERTRAIEPWDALVSDDVDASVLQALVDARLLVVSEGEGGEPLVEVVHEALIRHWDRLGAWLSEDAEGQRLVHTLTQAARDWERRGRPTGLLWSGDVLAEYRLWAAGGGQLAEPARSFAEASVRRERTSVRVRQGLVAAFVLGVSAAAVGLAVQAGRLDRARDAAVAQGESLRQLALLAEAERLRERGQADASLALLRAAVRPDAPDHAVVHRIEQALASGEAVMHLPPAWQEQVDLAPDGHRALFAGREPTGSCLLVDLDTGVEVDRWVWTGPPPGFTRASATPPVECRFGPDGAVWVARQLHRVERFEPGHEAPTLVLDVPGQAWELAPGPDALFVQSTTVDPSFDAEAWWSGPRTTPLADVGVRGHVTRFDLPSGDRAWQAGGRASPMNLPLMRGAPVRSPSGALVYARDRMLDAETGAVLWEDPAPPTPAGESLLRLHAWGPGDRLVAWGGGEVTVREGPTGAVLRTMPGDTATVTPNGMVIALRGSELWGLATDLDGPHFFGSFHGPVGRLGGVFPDGSLAAISPNRTVEVRSLQDGALIHGFPVSGAYLTKVDAAGLWIHTTLSGLRWIREARRPARLNPVPSERAALSVWGDRLAYALDGRLYVDAVPLPVPHTRYLHVQEDGPYQVSHSLRVALGEQEGRLLVQPLLDGEPAVLLEEPFILGESLGMETFVFAVGRSHLRRLHLRDGTGEDLPYPFAEPVGAAAFAVAPKGRALFYRDAARGVHEARALDAPRLLWSRDDLAPDAMYEWLSEDRIVLADALPGVLLLDAVTGRDVARIDTEASLFPVVAALSDGRGVVWTVDELVVFALDTGAVLQRVDVPLPRLDRDLVGSTMSGLWPADDGRHLVLRTREGISVLRTDTWLRVADHPGCDQAAIVGDRLRLLCGKSVLEVPLIDPRPDTVLARSGALTNLRVCRDTVRVVPVTPFPAPESVWAPDAMCEPADGLAQGG